MARQPDRIPLSVSGIACGWRIRIPRHVCGQFLFFTQFPGNSKTCSPSIDCYDDAAMRDIAILFIHLVAIIAKLTGPGGTRAVIAESLLVKHQLTILNRSRERAPNLNPTDRVITALSTLFIRPRRLLRTAIVLKPSTLLAFHSLLVKRKYRQLFSPKRRGKPGPKRAFA